MGIGWFNVKGQRRRIDPAKDEAGKSCTVVAKSRPAAPAGDQVFAVCWVKK